VPAIGAEAVAEVSVYFSSEASAGLDASAFAAASGNDIPEKAPGTNAAALGLRAIAGFPAISSGVPPPTAAPRSGTDAGGNDPEREGDAADMIGEGSHERDGDVPPCTLSDTSLPSASEADG